jgi:hypothetical protein
MSGNNEDNNFIKLEYPTLRTEILQLMEMRQKTVEIALTISAALIALALAKNEMFSPSLALIYPLIASCLAIGWRKYDIRIDLLKKYIKEIEVSFSNNNNNNGWEHYRENREISRLISTTMSQFLAFFSTQIVAVFVGYFLFFGQDKTPIYFRYTLLIVDAISILFLFYLVYDKIIGRDL